MNRIDNFSIAPPYNRVYELVTPEWLNATGYGWEEADDIYFEKIFEEAGLEFAGYAVAQDIYFDMCEDAGEDLVCVDIDGYCYIVIDDDLVPATDWRKKHRDMIGDYYDHRHYDNYDKYSGYDDYDEFD